MEITVNWSNPSGAPLYIVKHVPEHGLEIALVPGLFDAPVRLSLVVRASYLVGRALENEEEGANLAICMGQAAALKLFSEIRKMAREMGWPLPTEDGS